MSAPQSGSLGEAAAAVYLERHGFTIIERNFKTPRCEIDIIARKGNCLYFVEVKYRASNRQGGGLEYITATKLEHMRRAAEVWLQQQTWRGEVTLSAIEVTANYEVADFIESLA